MILFYVTSADGECNSFVRALSSADALGYWKAVYLGKHDDEDEIEIIEVPCNSGVVGVIPWDTLKIEEIAPYPPEATPPK